MDNRLNGLNPLSYMGVAPLSVAQLIYRTFDPTSTDSQNFSIGCVWINTTSETAWILMSLAQGVADWVKFTGSVGSLLTLTGNTGGPISPLVGNINVVGAGDITITGNPGTNTLTVTNSGTAADSFHTQSGANAIPIAGVINIVGTGVISTSSPGVGNTVTIAASGAVASSFPTNSGTAVPSSGVLNVLGTTNQITTSGSGNTVTAAFTPSIIVANNITSTVGNITASSGNIVANEIANDSNGAIFATFKSRAGAVVQVADTLGNLQFYGFDGTGFVLTSSIKVTASGTIGTNRIGSDLEFYTHPDSTGSPVDRMVITSTGTVVINSPDSGQGLVVGANIQCAGDSGAGTASSTSLTNIINTTQSTGTLSIKSTTANSGNNTGFLKIYVGTTVAYIPYFVTISP